MKKKLYLLAGMVCMLAAYTPSQAQSISTVAGNGTAGFGPDGIAATTSKLNNPYGVAVDNAGNVYIADADNNRVRKVDVSGNITTIAGTGSGSFSGDGGPATNAELHAPKGIAVDAAGNVFVSDLANNCIRKITPAGMISTVAGNGALASGYGGDGGLATAPAAKLKGPLGVAVDAAGNLYIADQINSVIRKVSSAGIISTIAGNYSLPLGFSGDGGPATAARLNDPIGVAVDGSGNVYITDFSNKIRKVNTAGIISTVVGVVLPGSAPGYGFSGDGGPATAAHLYSPEGIAVDGPGNIYFNDWNNFCVRKVNATTGIINTIAGVDITNGFSGDGGPALHAQMSYATGVAVRNNGDVYIADNANQRIRRIKYGNNPFFSDGHNQSIIMCPVEFISIDTILSIDDIDVGQSETWSAVAAPLHGTLVAAYSATSTGSTVIPSGLQYAPAPGYAGLDSFKVRVVDATGFADTTTVHVVIVPYPQVSPISGIDSVCPGFTRTLTDTARGGVWTSSNTALATVASSGIDSGLVHGVAPGTMLITYTYTNYCGSAYTTYEFKVLSTTPCISGANQLAGIIQEQLSFVPNPSQGTFSIAVSSSVTQDAAVVITNIMGRKVMEFNLPANKPREVKLEQPAGIYFISAKTISGNITGKITISR